MLQLTRKHSSQPTDPVEGCFQVVVEMRNFLICNENSKQAGGTDLPKISALLFS
jgi:hypothetical protein